MNSIDAIYELKFNPFKYAEYLTSFYRAVHDVDNNLLLAQLVIPLCSHTLFADKLKNANKKSSIWSIFNDRSKLYDLQERIDEFVEITKQCIQYCLINDWLMINSDILNVKYIASHSQTNAWKLQKNATNLGRLLSNFTVDEIYAFLGVKPR